MTTRTDALNQAAALINGDRQDDYGDAGESFARLAQIWAGILGAEITAAQVVMCLAGLKLSRLAHTPDHADSWIDLIGYAALGAEVSHDPKRQDFSKLGTDRLNDIKERFNS